MTGSWEGRPRGQLDVNGRLLTLDHVVEKGTSHSGLDLLAVSAIGSSFRECSFTDLKVEDFHFGGTHERSTYIDCAFDRSVIRAIAPGSVRFERCTFQDVVLTEWFCFKAEFIECRFTGTLKKVIFNGWDDAPDSALNEYFGNDFSGATLIDVDFRRGIDLSKQVLPSGDDYLFIEAAEPILRRWLQRLAESGEKDLEDFVGSLLQDMEREEMNDLFLTRRGWSRMRQETVDELFALLG